MRCIKVSVSLIMNKKKCTLFRFNSPWGKVTWNGLVVFLRFHIVRLPSEWLHMNCFPSWCQLTEWMACIIETEQMDFYQDVIHIYANTRVFPRMVVIHAFTQIQQENALVNIVTHTLIKPHIPHLPLNIHPSIEYMTINKYWQKKCISLNRTGTPSNISTACNTKRQHICGALISY